MTKIRDDSLRPYSDLKSGLPETKAGLWRSINVNFAESVTRSGGSRLVFKVNKRLAHVSDDSLVPLKAIISADTTPMLIREQLIELRISLPSSTST